MGSINGCCNRNDTSGNRDGKLIGYNSSQKIYELKLYRFFISNLYNLMMTNNKIETLDFYFIKKSWIKSWYQYTYYKRIRPLLMKNEINNEIDFHKAIIDSKKIDFDILAEKVKPPPIQFFKINTINTNINENFYIFDSQILEKFLEIYGTKEDIKTKQDSFLLKGEIGKGRILFDVKEYILIMVLNFEWEIKQMMILFDNMNDHNKFVNKINGRAMSFIKDEIEKITAKKKMIKYKKDKIFIYDGRKFVIDEYFNNSFSLIRKDFSDTHVENVKRMRNLKLDKDKENIENNHNKIIYKSYVQKKYREK